MGCMLFSRIVHITVSISSFVLLVVVDEISAVQHAAHSRCVDAIRCLVVCFQISQTSREQKRRTFGFSLLVCCFRNDNKFKCLVNEPNVGAA